MPLQCQEVESVSARVGLRISKGSLAVRESEAWGKSIILSSGLS